MCDPVSLLVGAVGGMAVSGAMGGRGGGGSAPAGDPEAERLKAEADAAASANRKLAADQKRRREQQSLIARGAPQPSLGDEQSTDGVLSKSIKRLIPGGVRDGGFRPSSLISRGASSTPISQSPGSAVAGGSGGRVTRGSQVAY